MEDKDYQAARQKRQTALRKYRKMFGLLAEVVEDYGLLQLIPLDIQNATSVGRVVAAVDKANGFVFIDDGQQQAPRQRQDMFQCAVNSSNNRFEDLADIQETNQAKKAMLQQQQKQQQSQDASS
mmetsp:Transcript_11877/g.27509  ORF Transcript_11877/g.27509 Transcript_11877/m.27509 type:complete len:124 (-) Transcript_11877:10-381(-)